MKQPFLLLVLSAILGIASGLCSGCARRMTVLTGTTIGLHVTPGDGQSQTPQVTLAYKRAEIALVPTAGLSASNSPASDAYSALAVIDFRTKWFSGTSIDQFIATGHASRDIQEGDEFATQLMHFAKTDAAKRIQSWIKTAPNIEERKRRQQAMTDWIGNSGYSFADLLYQSGRETERQRFLTEKAQSLNIP